jgi:hypothetical protein
MAGINQTILMNLSMVVVASFMEAEGVGARILQALQYVAKGQGLLGGLATLFCAMVIDKIAQGSYRQGHKKTDRGYRTASTIVLAIDVTRRLPAVSMFGILAYNPDGIIQYT